MKVLKVKFDWNDVVKNEVNAAVEIVANNTTGTYDDDGLDLLSVKDVNLDANDKEVYLIANFWDVCDEGFLGIHLEAFHTFLSKEDYEKFKDKKVSIGCDTYSYPVQLYSDIELSNNFFEFFRQRAEYLLNNESLEIGCVTIHLFDAESIPENCKPFEMSEDDFENYDF